MNKKKIIIISSIGVVFLIIVFLLISVNASKNKCLDEYKDKISNKINIISSIVNKYSIGLSGEVEVVANYKGAHGENYPANFNYNYSLDDKLYFEDEEYTSIDVNKNLLSVIDSLKNIENVDVSKYESVKKSGNKIKIIYNEKNINEVLKTDFKSISAEINMSGFIRKIKEINIILDDINITVNRDDLHIIYNSKTIDLNLKEDATYVNINNKLKMNIFTKNNYNFSIVFNNQVYSLELLEDGFNLKFNTSASIYNSMSIKVKYKSVSLEKKREAKNYNDNPIIRYLSESDLSL